MVAFSKRRGVLQAVLILAMLSLLQTTTAQMFADVDYKSGNSAKGHMGPNPQMMGAEYDDDDEQSAVSKLNGSSTWWDLIFAHQKDMFNNVGAYKQLREGAQQLYGLLTKD